MLTRNSSAEVYLLMTFAENEDLNEDSKKKEKKKKRKKMEG